MSYDELKENLIAELYKQGKKHGLILTKSMGGLTLPEESFFQTYPLHVFGIDKKGNEKRFKGVYVVGTPHQILSNILQTSNVYDVFNGVCRAESGYIPSTETAPHALVRSLEVNRIPLDSYVKVSRQLF